MPPTNVDVNSGPPSKVFKDQPWNLIQITNIRISIPTILLDAADEFYKKMGFQTAE